MFTFRKARRIFEKIRKPDRSKKGENALQRIRNMLNKYETPITLALLFLWDDYNIDEETADEVMSKLAIRYREMALTITGNILSIAEPSIVIIFSLLVGLVLLSVMMPLLGILSEIVM